MDSLEGKMLRIRRTGPSPEGAPPREVPAGQLSERSDVLIAGPSPSSAPEGTDLKAGATSTR
jgi:hypothetical protein